jgi:hypothetical protein
MGRAGLPQFGFPGLRRVASWVKGFSIAQMILRSEAFTNARLQSSGYHRQFNLQLPRSRGKELHRRVLAIVGGCLSNSANRRKKDIGTSCSE